MKRIAMALGAFFLLSGSALAADVSAPAYDWTGAYVGLNAGVAWNNSKWSDPATPPGYAPFKTDGSGFAGGGQLGYRYQIDHIVLGLEGAADYVDIDGRAGCEGTIPTCITKQDFLGSVQASLGLAFDRFLVYGTGGIAFGDYSYSEKVSLAQSWHGGMRTGWTIGAGAEFALNQSWSVGAQWNYYDFGTKTEGGGSNPPSVKFGETENIVTLRVNYRF